MSALRVTGLGVALSGHDIVRDLDFKVGEGEVLGLVGPNGAGKTTVLRAILGLVPSAGRVELVGRAVGELTVTERGRAMAYLPQIGPLHWPLRVDRLVALGRLPHRGAWDRLSLADDEAVTRALAATDALGLRHRKASELSGGERARVLLARALAVEAPVLLADEPIAALDPAHQLAVMAYLRREAEKGRAIVIVLHDLTMAARFTDRLLLLDNGAKVAEGPPREVLSRENLKDVYGIEIAGGEELGPDVILPWRRIKGL